MTHKLTLTDLKVSKIINDKEGRLLVLEVKYPSTDGVYQLLSYMIKGNHERNQSNITYINQTFWDKDEMSEGGDSIAEYLSGKWYFKG